MAALHPKQRRAPVITNSFDRNPVKNQHGWIIVGTVCFLYFMLPSIVFYSCLSIGGISLLRIRNPQFNHWINTLMYGDAEHIPATNSLFSILFSSIQAIVALTVWTIHWIHHQSRTIKHTMDQTSKEFQRWERRESRRSSSHSRQSRVSSREKVSGSFSSAPLSSSVPPDEILDPSQSARVIQPFSIDMPEELIVGKRGHRGISLSASQRSALADIFRSASTPNPENGSPI